MVIVIAQVMVMGVIDDSGLPCQNSIPTTPGLITCELATSHELTVPQLLLAMTQQVLLLRAYHSDCSTFTETINCAKVSDKKERELVEVFSLSWTTTWINFHVTSSSPVKGVIWLRRHQQATNTAEDVPHSNARGVTGAKNPMTDSTTAVDVTVIYLHG